MITINLVEDNSISAMWARFCHNHFITFETFCKGIDLLLDREEGEYWQKVGFVSLWRALGDKP